MCVVSMVADHYREKWGKAPTYKPMPAVTSGWTTTISPVDHEEFDALKREVEEMKMLLKRAKEYDERNGEPDCEMDEKVALLRKVADAVGVNLDDVFGRSE